MLLSPEESHAGLERREVEKIMTFTIQIFG